MIAVLLALAFAEPAAVADLGWMGGRWETVSGERSTEESWPAPRGGMMPGFNSETLVATISAIDGGNATSRTYRRRP
ncbi:MAG TPA: DUF6265 family protein [Allosphingosinicella sp.]